MSDTTPETPVEPAAGEAVIVPPLAGNGENAEPGELVEPEPSVVEPALVEPAVAEPALVEPVVERSALAEPGPVESADHEPIAVEETRHSEATHVSDASPELVDESHDAPLATPQQTVYVHAPVAPAKKGNRGIGSLIALVSAIIFAAIYAGLVLVVVPLFAPPRAVGFEFMNFITSAAFFIPVLVFAVAFILLVLILNRAGWWAYVLGSLFVGVVVYFASIGILLLINGVIGSTFSEGLGAFRAALQSPVTVIAGLVGREVALWMGAAIAARGRRVKARNVEARAAYDRDTARARADYERAVATNAAH